MLYHIKGYAFNDTSSGLVLVGGDVVNAAGGAGPAPTPGSGGGQFTASVCLVNKTAFIRRTCKWLQNQSR